MATFAASLSIGASSAAMAGPTGGTVVQGQGTISTPSSTQTVINQSSQQLTLNWSSFNVGSNESVRFYQPSSSSVAFNRILGQSASQIFGRIDANGQVVLINPNGLLIDRDYDASVPEFRGDREQLIQALLNVVRNAAQALHARIATGDACVQLRTRVAQQVTMLRRPCRLALDLRVIDNGPGIPEELKERVFDPLVSGRESGSGLGLSLAQEFIHQNGGTIDFESVPGRTDFRILLPLR